MCIAPGRAGGAELDRPTGQKVKVDDPRWRCFGALCTLVFATFTMGLGAARAAPARHQRADVDLPLAGLRVNLVLPPDMTARVTSRWDADHYEDVLTLAGDGRDMTYTIELAGRTAKDCPLVDPFPLELGGEVWIEARGAPTPTICRMLLDARAVVRITSTTDSCLLYTSPSPRD